MHLDVGAPGPCGVVTLGSSVARTPVTCLSAFHRASRGGRSPSSTAAGSRVCARAHRRACWSDSLLSTILAAHALCLRPPWPEQLHRHWSRGMTLGTPNRTRRIWRYLSLALGVHVHLLQYCNTLSLTDGGAPAPQRAPTRNSAQQPCVALLAAACKPFFSIFTLLQCS